MLDAVLEDGDGTVNKTESLPLRSLHFSVDKNAKKINRNIMPGSVKHYASL